MTRYSMRFAALAAFALLAAPGPSTARPYTIDDFLKTEQFGKVSIAPGGHWLVFERRIALDDAPRFGMAAMNEIRDRLFVADMDHPGPARPLVSLASDVATVALGFSPGGTRIAIGRLDAHSFQLGVVTLATGAVRWLPVTPDYDGMKPTLAWISEDALVTMAEPHETRPWRLRTDDAARDQIPALWDRQRNGTGPTVTAVGSGASQAVTPRRPALTLMRVDVVSGTIRTLGQGPYHSLVAAPGGRALALVENGSTNIVPPGKLGLGGIDPYRRLLRIVDSDSGEAWSPFDSHELPFGPPIWSPDGTRLLVFAHRQGVGWEGGEVLLVNVARHRTTRLALDNLAPVLGGLPNMFASASFGWSSGAPVLLARDRAGVARWFRLGQSEPVALTGKLAAPDSELAAGLGQAGVVLDKDRAWRLGGRRQAPLLSGVVGITDGPGKERIAFMTDGRGEHVDISFPASCRPLRLPAAATPVAADPARAIVVARVPEPDGSERLIMAGRTGSQTLAQINMGRGEIEHAEPIAVRYDIPGSGRATSWLYVPPGTQGRRLPMVTIAYPGQVYGETPPSPDGRMLGQNIYEVAALVGHGYAVLVASMPHLAPSSDHPFDFAGQLLPAVDAAIATGRIDPHRLGLWGHSFGGYMVATTLAQTDRFTAAIAADGLYDLLAFQGTFGPTSRIDPEEGQSPLSWTGWAETGQLGLGVTAWSDTRRYVVNSPAYRADRIHTPLLLIAADQDIAPLQQSEEMYSALYRFAKDAQLRTYWGEDHAPLSPPNVRDQFASAFRWFDDHFARAGDR